jgi:small GTP-binding protein
MMTNFDQIQTSLPPDVQKTLKKLWETLPTPERNTLLNLLNGLPSDTNLLRTLIRLSVTQFRYTFGKKSHVAIIGPANVGKSTLYNQFIQTKQDKAEVSPIPGTTKINQKADAGLFSIVDTPGADAVGPQAKEQQESALNAADEADFVIILFDAVQGIKQTELDLYKRLVDLKKPHIVVLNKVDLVQKDLKKIIEISATNLGIAQDQIIPIAAKDGKNLSQILLGIAATEPEIVAALGQALPVYRWQLAWKTIVSAASVAGVIALAPIPIIDFAPLIITQSTMVLGIARIYNYKINLERAKELVATFGLGFLGRSIFQELSKLGGLPGWLLSAAIAASTTVVMGYAAAKWFESGERLSGETLKKMTESLTKTLLDSLKNLGKPKKKVLQQKIAESLEKSTLAKDIANQNDENTLE